MYSLTPMVYKNRIKPDGSAGVVVRLIKDRKIVYLPTNIMAQKADIAKGVLKSTSLVFSQAMGIVKEAREIIALIPLADFDNMTASDLLEHVKTKMTEKREGFHLDFVQFMKEKAGDKPTGSRNGYIAAANALERYAHGAPVDISTVTVRFLRGFEEFLRTEGNQRGHKEGDGARKVSKYLGCVRHMHNLARVEYNDPDLGILRIPFSPFDYYKIPAQPAPKHKNKSVELIQKLIDTRKDCSGRERLGVDVFLISLSLMGMNAPDLYSVKMPKDGILVYNRQKTTERRADKAEMHVRIEDCVLPLLAGYAGRDGVHAFDLYDRYATFDNLTHAVNIGLREWCGKNGEEPFTLYSARHSWATIARSSRCGIDPATVDYCLAHAGEYKLLDIYAEKDWEVFWKANAKVLALFDWSRL